MMTSIEIFKDLSDFTSYVDGFMPDTTFGQLGPSVRATAKEISRLVTPEVYGVLSDAPVSDTLSEGHEHLKTALASGAVYRYAIFAAVKKNGSEASLYKYQYEEIRRHHIDAFWQAMDWLLEWLDEHAEEVKWKTPEGESCYAESKAYKERQSLPVRSASEFDYYYGIDNSAFFFSKIQYIIRTVWTQKILPVIRDSKDERVLDLAKRSLCYQVMAKAVMQFDVTELPRSIRYDFNHEYTKGSSMQSRDRLYAQLMAEVESWNASIETILKASSGSMAIQNNLNKEENKHYTML